MRHDRRLRTAALAVASAWLFALPARAARSGLCATAASGTPTAPYLAVISAYPAELAPIAAATAVETTVQIDGRPYYVGRLGGVHVLLGLTGIGIRNATEAAQSLLAPGQLQIRHRRLLAVTRQAALLENRGSFGPERIAGSGRGGDDCEHGARQCHPGLFHDSVSRLHA